MRRIPSVALAVVMLVAMLAPVPMGTAHAKTGKRHSNWIHPAFASFRIGRIALLPVATYDENVAIELLVEEQIPKLLGRSGYQWISASASRDMLHAQPATSRLGYETVRKSLLASKTARADSLVAPELCERLNCDALFSIRVEIFQQGQMWIKGALVDKSGTLLWTGNRTSTGEVIAEPSPYTSTLTMLLRRFAAQLPARTGGPSL